MASHPPEARTFELFAALLDYPRTDLAAAAEECADHVAQHSTDAAAALREFASFARRTSRARLEEIYTGLFELDASHHPYLGYHLFGESYKRSAFLLGLKARYRSHGVECGAELPDHLSVVLRFLAVNESPDEARELIEEALQPALEKMMKRSAAEPPEPAAPETLQPDQEYRGLLRSLELWIHALAPKDELVPAIAPGARAGGGGTPC